MAACLNPAIEESSNETGLRVTEVAISPSGTWRAAVQQRSSDSKWYFHRSSDGGVSWGEIEAPSHTINIAGAPESNYRVAVADDGTLHAIRCFDAPANPGTRNDIYYYTYAGSWSAGVFVVQQNAAGTPPAGLTYDGTLLVIVTAENGGASKVRYSTDGTTWTAGTGSAPVVDVNAHFIGLIGGYMHVTRASGGAFQYERWDASTHAWVSVTTPPSFPSVSSQRGASRLMSRHGSTSELFVAIPHSSIGADALYLFRSTDSGDTWATILSGEALPAGWQSDARLYFTGATMGDDDLLHLWGSARDGSGDVITISRELTSGGTYGSLERLTPEIAVEPAGGELFGSQPSGGSYTRPLEAWGSFQIGAGSTRALIWLGCIQAIAFVPPLQVGHHGTHNPPGIAGPPLRAGPAAGGQFSPQVQRGHRY